MCPPTTNRALQCVPLLSQHHLPNPGCCNMFSSPLILQMLRCVPLLPTQNVVICWLPLSGCSDTILRLRMMLCVLRHARVAAQAAIAKQDAANASEEAAHHPPHPVGLPVPEDAATMCSPQPTGCYVTYHTVMCLLCLSLPQDAMMCPPPSIVCDDASAQRSVCCCYVFSLSHRMLQWMVLSQTEVAAEQAVTVQKVDQHAPSQAEEVHAEAEVVHHHPQVYHNLPVKVSPSLHCGGDLCDGLIVIDEQGGIVNVSFFLLSHILGGFSLNNYFTSFLILTSLPLLAPGPCSSFPRLPCSWIERLHHSLVALCSPTCARVVSLCQPMQTCQQCLQFSFSRGEDKLGQSGGFE